MSVSPSFHTAVFIHTIFCHEDYRFPCVRSLVLVRSRTVDQLLSGHAEWSTWWDHSWQSATPWSSALHCNNQSQSHDWTALPSQPRHRHWFRLLHLRRPLLPPRSCRAQVTFGLNVSTQTFVVSLAHCTSGCIYSGCSTQCGLQRCLHSNSPFPSSSNGAFLSKALPCRSHPLLQPWDISTIHSLSSTRPQTQRDEAQQRRLERKATMHERRHASTVLAGKHSVSVFPVAAADSEVLHLRYSRLRPSPH